MFDDARMPEGYTFVPNGNLYIIRKCRGMTKDSAQVVYKNFVSALYLIPGIYLSTTFILMLINFLGQYGQGESRDSSAS